MGKVDVPGSMSRSPMYAGTFLVPVPRLLKDKQIRQHGPRLFEVVTDDPNGIRIESNTGKLEVILEAGYFFYSIEQDFRKSWHVCHHDHSIKA